VVLLAVADAGGTEGDATVGQRFGIVIVPGSLRQGRQVAAVGRDTVDVEERLAGGGHREVDRPAVVGDAGRSDQSLAGIVQQADLAVGPGGNEAVELAAEHGRCRRVVFEVRPGPADSPDGLGPRRLGLAADEDDAGGPVEVGAGLDNPAGGGALSAAGGRGAGVREAAPRGHPHRAEDRGGSPVDVVVLGRGPPGFGQQVHPPRLVCVDLDGGAVLEFDPGRDNKPRRPAHVVALDAEDVLAGDQERGDVVLLDRLPVHAVVADVAADERPVDVKVIAVVGGNEDGGPWRLGRQIERLAEVAVEGAVLDGLGRGPDPRRLGEVGQLERSLLRSGRACTDRERNQGGNTGQRDGRTRIRLIERSGSLAASRDQARGRLRGTRSSTPARCRCVDFG